MYIKKVCSSCGEIVKFYFSESLYSLYNRTWHGGYSCSKCGSSLEVDGTGKIEGELREIILAKDGVWGLNLELTGMELTQALFILRKFENLTIEDIKTMKKLVPGIVLNGTKIEMIRLHKILLEKSIDSKVVKLD